MKPVPHFEKELIYWEQGLSVVGVDEVGRGCLAGPVVAGAVSFHPDHVRINGITDSKKLTHLKRLLFDDQIKSSAASFGIGISSVDEINTLGIVPATFLAMERALLSLPKVEVVLVDGNLVPKFTTLKPTKIQIIIKGDQIAYSISCASIIAKVYRDDLMRKLSNEFPSYAWEKNKGYGTNKHLEAIRQKGLSSFHRTLFCRKVQMNNI